MGKAIRAAGRGQVNNFLEGLGGEDRREVTKLIEADNLVNLVKHIRDIRPTFKLAEATGLAKALIIYSRD